MAKAFPKHHLSQLEAQPLHAVRKTLLIMLAMYYYYNEY
jgi:hypothetical protein